MCLRLQVDYKWIIIYGMVSGIFILHRLESHVVIFLTTTVLELERYLHSSPYTNRQLTHVPQKYRLQDITKC